MASRTTEQHVSMPLLRASWLNIAFVHWRVSPQRLQALLPAGLTVDEYDGAAWVGLTPFVMANMRPVGLSDLPGRRSQRRHKKSPPLFELSSTPETNLRTYVRGPDGRDGLWFLTIDVGSAPLAATLRAAVGAPYHRGRLAVERRDDAVIYTGSRRGGPEAYRLEVRPGVTTVQSDLETWLTGRWRAYTAHLGRLIVTPVDHEPWPLQQAGLRSLEQNLTDSVGLDSLSEPSLVHFSQGVQEVRLGRPRPLPHR